MLIQCTKKLLDQLNIKSVELIDEEPLFSWHANLIRIDRRKTIVLTNDKNRYVIVLYGLKAKNFRKLDEIIIQAIYEAFKSSCIKEEIIEQFINCSKEVIYTKTKNNSLVARLNHACNEVYFFGRALNNASVFQNRVSVKASQSLVNDNGKYVVPIEEMYKGLEELFGKPVRGCMAAELKVTLALKRHNIWRKMVVPLNLTFEQLHSALQIVFGWQDCHLHEFYVFDGDKPIVNLVNDEEAFDYPSVVTMKLEQGIRLSEYVPEYKRIKYYYDFGDGWQHYIEVERIITDYDKYYPVCLEGEGNTPPEDVGGECGYEEFLEIIADKNHPEHDCIADWGRSQGYQDFDIEMVNRRLKYL